MLIQKYMTILLLRVVTVFIDLLLMVIPESSPEKIRRSAPGIPRPGWAQGGWIFKEVVSPVTGCIHRYYHHASVKKDAPVFLFLHGLFFDGRNFLNVAGLSDTWSLIAYDFPQSTELYRGNMNDFKFLIDDFLDCLKIESVYLCGVSFGGGIGIHYAALNPAKVKALVLVSTFVMNSKLSDQLKSSSMSGVLLKYSDGKLYWLVDHVLQLAFSGAKNPMRLLRGLVYVKDMQWYRQAFRSLSTFDGSRESKMIKCPVLGIHGTADKAVPVKRALSIPEHITHAHFQKIEKGTHAIMYLQGTIVSQMIRNFCSGVVKK